MSTPVPATVGAVTEAEPTSVTVGRREEQRLWPDKQQLEQKATEGHPLSKAQPHPRGSRPRRKPLPRGPGTAAPRAWGAFALFAVLFIIECGWAIWFSPLTPQPAADLTAPQVGVAAYVNRSGEGFNDAMSGHDLDKRIADPPVARIAVVQCDCGTPTVWITLDQIQAPLLAIRRVVFSVPGGSHLVPAPNGQHCWAPGDWTPDARAWPREVGTPRPGPGGTTIVVCKLATMDGLYYGPGNYPHRAVSVAITAPEAFVTDELGGTARITFQEGPAFEWALVHPVPGTWVEPWLSVQGRRVNLVAEGFTGTVAQMYPDSAVAVAPHVVSRSIVAGEGANNTSLYVQWQQPTPRWAQLLATLWWTFYGSGLWADVAVSRSTAGHARVLVIMWLAALWFTPLLAGNLLASQPARFTVCLSAFALLVATAIVGRWHAKRTIATLDLP